MDQQLKFLIAWELGFNFYVQFEFDFDQELEFIVYWKLKLNFKPRQFMCLFDY